MAQDARDCPGGSKVGLLPTGGRGMTRAVLAVVAGVVAGGLWVPAPLAAQTASLPVAADTYLRSGSANQSQGSDSFLRLQSSGNNRALLSVSTSDLVQTVGSGRLVSASLELYVQSNGNNWGPDGRTVDVHRLLADWSEAGATWNCGVDTDPGNSQPDCDPAVGRRHLRRRAERHGAAQQRSDRLGGVRRHRGRGGLSRRRAELRLAAQEDRGKPERQGGLHLARGRGRSAAEAGPARRERRRTTWCRRRLAIVEPHEPILVNETSPTDRRRLSPTAARESTSPDVGGGAWTASPLSGCAVAATGATCTAPSLAAGSHAVHADAERPRRQPGGGRPQPSSSCWGPGLSTVSFEAVGRHVPASGEPQPKPGGRDAPPGSLQRAQPGAGALR